MGEVWAGVHATRGVPVAVKLIRAEVFDDAAERDFQREVWAQARLDHPAVLYLYDHGRLAEDAATAFGMPVGAPWLAMEKCSSRLSDQQLDWQGLRQVVIPLLEALGHAHSRGVLHRDIKIANVLVATADDLRPGVKLADFGIAHVLADEDEETRAAGTPRYMAPEQVTADWEQHGPWTDLYAMGVLTWRLVMNRKPWARLNGRDLLMAMLRKDLSWPTPRISVPPGLRGWIERMTHKNPVKRYQLAADALADFRALPVLCSDGFWLPNISSLTGTLIPEDVPVDVARRTSFVNPIEDPPIASEASIRMNAAGLGLLAMRQPEFIGRRVERRVLWDHLHRVSKRGEPVAISLLGPPRIGRGRFQQWFSEAAEQAGQAVCVWVDCVPGRPLGRQVAKSLRAWFRTGNLEDDQAIEHLRSWLPQEAFVPRLAAMLRTLEPPEDWVELVALTLAGLGEVRPLILQLRGVGEHGEVQALVDAVLSRPRATVVMVLDNRVVGGDVLELGPLDDASMTRLSDALVALEPGVRANLVRRSSGSPGYLVHTLQHWARSGRLEADAQGFHVTGNQDEVPPALDVVASSRLQALERAVSAQGIESLTHAAVIGQTVDIELWERVDGAERSAVRRDLLAELSSRGLVQEEVGHFRFASVAFRQRVLLWARDRLPELHARCAAALVDGDPLELGRHRLEAGMALEALEPLARGLHATIEEKGGRAGLAEVGLLEAAVQALSGPQRLRWQAILKEIQASIYLDLGDLERTEACSREVLRTAVVLSDSTLLARCWAHIGAVAGHRGRLATRKDAYRRALEMGTEAPAGLRAEWWTSLGTSMLGLGDTDGWRSCMAEAASSIATDATGRSAFRIGLARAVEAQLEGNVEGALLALGEAYASASEAGVTTGRVAVLRARAHTLMGVQRFEEANRAFQAALELAVLARPSRAPAILANAVALEFVLDQDARAVETFRRHSFLLPPGRDGARRQLPAHAAALAVATIDRDWRRATYHLDKLRRHGAWQWAELQSGLWLCEKAVREAGEGGRPRLAERIAKTALAASERSGDPALRERIRRAAGLPVD